MTEHRFKTITKHTSKSIQFSFHKFNLLLITYCFNTKISFVYNFLLITHGIKKHCHQNIILPEKLLTEITPESVTTSHYNY